MGALRLALSVAGRWLLPVLIVPVALFMLAGWIGSSIPRNADWTEPAEGVTIFLASNGVHTEIVMPVETPAMDWRDRFPTTDLKAPERDYTHVAVSWGERSFFLETPTWAEFDPLTAVGALAGGEALIHAAFYENPQPSETFRPLRLREEEYRALARQIVADLPAHETIHPGYGTHDVFYAVKGSYHLGNTCNQWTSDRLARAGVATGWWTPMPGGVMKWVPDLRE